MNTADSNTCGWEWNECMNLLNKRYIAPRIGMNSSNRCTKRPFNDLHRNADNHKMGKLRHKSFLFPILKFLPFLWLYKLNSISLIESRAPQMFVVNQNVINQNKELGKSKKAISRLHVYEQTLTSKWIIPRVNAIPVPFRVRELYISLHLALIFVNCAVHLMDLLE